jgi:hypothetical protein
MKASKHRQEQFPPGSCPSFLPVYLGWNSDTDISFTEKSAAGALWLPGPPDTLGLSPELNVSPCPKANAGFDGAAKLEVWPWSMTRTSSMAGRSAGFSCTQRSPRWMHLSTSLSGAWESSDGSMVSSAVPFDQRSHTCRHVTTSQDRVYSVTHIVVPMNDLVVFRERVRGRD